MSQIRVDILLPLYYNPDLNGTRREIEDQKFSDTYDELIFHFGGYSMEKDTVRGEWISDETGLRIDDELRNLWVICEDKPAHIDFLVLLKERLMERFDQEEILMFYNSVKRF